MLPLSQSPAWQQQRAFYEDRASEAFAEIPHEAVDNPWVAAAYARVIEAFVRDQPVERVQIVELGAGAGRFAHGLARALRLPFTYTLTDFAESQLDDWRKHPALEGFQFARVDLTGDIALDVSGPLVVIANYVFDSLPVDAFAVKDGVISECLVDEDFRFTRRPATGYGDADLDALLEHYRTALDDTVFTIPTTAIRALRRLRELSGDRLLVLAADKSLNTEESLAYRSEPEPARHSGAFSLMVNMHALGLDARRHGGELLHGGDRHEALDVAALVFGAGDETRAAYADAIERFGPGDLATLTAGVERVADGLGVGEIVALLRLSGWDATTLHAVLGPLRDKAAEADPATQEDLRFALFETYDQHFAVPGDPDLPFAIGLLLYELQDYEDAIEFFEASLEQHGHDPATEKNIELCEAMLE
ncbi:SAM-dependent methyltransferase [Solirubrobacter soli]|uniref:SAM-dependent methyltransferase n=1 Tax=Solirubrobacter soli TaxID=363832 RepID=UPI00056CD43A|nr:SAM-dependent methyltransferase [Solirubrobacter soli]